MQTWSYRLDPRLFLAMLIASTDPGVTAEASLQEQRGDYAEGSLARQAPLLRRFGVLSRAAVRGPALLQLAHALVVVGETRLALDVLGNALTPLSRASSLDRFHVEALRQVLPLAEQDPSASREVRVAAAAARVLVLNWPLTPAQLADAPLVRNALGAVLSTFPSVSVRQLKLPKALLEASADARKLLGDLILEPAACLDGEDASAAGTAARRGVIGALADAAASCPWPARLVVAWVAVEAGLHRGRLSELRGLLLPAVGEAVQRYQQAAGDMAR